MDENKITTPRIPVLKKSASINADILTIDATGNEFVHHAGKSFDLFGPFLPRTNDLVDGGVLMLVSTGSGLQEACTNSRQLPIKWNDGFPFTSKISHLVSF